VTGVQTCALPISERARAGDNALKGAPWFAPRRRLDETLAARKPVLNWNDETVEEAQAAE
jgi:glycine dehydrogenase subunit 2